MADGSHSQTQQAYRRRRFVILLVFALVIGPTAYALTAVFAPIPVTSAVVSGGATESNATPVPSLPIAWPSFGEGAVGALGFPGILSSIGPQAAVPIASITKLVTIFVVLEKYPLAANETGPTIDFTDADVAHYNNEVAQNGSVTPVSAGMQLTEQQTLEAVLIPSANNYATSLALWAFGSHDAYLAAAKEWLNKEGFTNTNVVDASGFSLSNVSTPAEVIELGRRALAHPVVSHIVSQPSIELPAIGMVENTNKLIGQRGISGIKTGTTDEAVCLLFSSNFMVGTHPVTMVGVLLGAETHQALNDAILTLVESVQPAFHEVQLSTAGTPVAEYTTPWGEVAQLVTTTDTSVVTWQDTPASTSITAHPMSTATAGDELGNMTFTVGSEVLTVPLTVATTVSDPGIVWRLTHPTALF